MMKRGSFLLQEPMSVVTDGIIVILAICIVVAPVFSGEYHRKGCLVCFFYSNYAAGRIRV